MRKTGMRLLPLLLSVLAVLILGACSNVEPSAEEPVSGEEPIHLKWYLGGRAAQPDQETVSNAMEDYLLEEYGLNLDLELITVDFGSYSDKARMVIASDEPYDIMWTANWCNNYYTNVSKGAFLPLDALLTDELRAVIPEALFDACRVNGTLYAIPSYQVSAFQNCVLIPTRLVEEFDLDVDRVTCLADLNDFFYDVKQAYPHMYPLGLENSKTFANLSQSHGYEYLINHKVPGAILLEEDRLQVINQFELPAVRELFELLYQWGKDGILRTDASTVQDVDPDLRRGLYASSVEATWKPYIETEKDFSEPITSILISDPWISTGSIIATMNSISKTCAHPEVAMEFLTLLNTDKTLYNMLCFGLEGVHYTLTEEGTVRTDPDAGYDPSCDWVFACQFNAIPREGQPLDIWEQTKAHSDSAFTSPVNGFTFDPTSVSNEIIACTTVFDQYFTPLCVGAVDPAVALPEAMEQMRIAGYDAIIAELQSQIDAWAADKNN